MKFLKSILLSIAVFIAATLLYLSFWPVSVDPVAWKTPEDKGYTGPHQTNQRLAAFEHISIGDYHGPEDVAIDQSGSIYAPTHSGEIIKLKPDGTDPEVWTHTQGRPLGLDFDSQGNLIVADAHRGLLSISKTKQINLLTNHVDGKPFGFPDDVDCAKDGKIYFTDASVKFGVKAHGGTLEASLLDLNEHGGQGRLLMYDPKTKQTKIMLKNLNFANGVAVSPDQNFLLLNETGSYRVLKYWLSGPKKGSSEVILDNLPGFPDNLSAGYDGRFWVALAAPRNALLDNLSEYPFLRKMIQRMPAFLRPKPAKFGHVIAIDQKGKVLEDLQDPTGRIYMTTGVLESKDALYIGSLHTPYFGRMKKSKLGL